MICVNDSLYLGLYICAYYASLLQRAKLASKRKAEPGESLTGAKRHKKGNKNSNNSLHLKRTLHACMRGLWRVGILAFTSFMREFQLTHNFYHFLMAINT